MTNTDLKELFFEHKVIEKVTDEPNFPKLHNLLRLLKANACTVPCTLGGGAHGYVRILVSVVSYASLAPVTPFVIPVNPGALPIVPGQTQFQIALAKSQHDKNLRLYNEYTLMQRALIQQVVSVIDEKYISALRNRVTVQLSNDVRAIFLYLFRIYVQQVGGVKL